MRLIGKATGQCHIDHRARGVVQHPLGLFNPIIHHELIGTVAQYLLEQPRKMRRTQTCHAGHVFDCDGFAEPVGNKVEHPLVVAGGKAPAEG